MQQQIQERVYPFILIQGVPTLRVELPVGLLTVLTGVHVITKCEIQIFVYSINLNTETV